MSFLSFGYLAVDETVMSLATCITWWGQRVMAPATSLTMAATQRRAYLLPKMRYQNLLSK